MHLARTPDDCSEQLSLATYFLYDTLSSVGLPDKEQRVYIPNVPDNDSLTATPPPNHVVLRLELREACCLLRRWRRVGAADSGS